MQVLCATTSGAGHWVPLLPLARALAAAGHEVLFACPDTAADALRGHGFDVEPFDEVAERTEEQRELMARAEATGDQQLAERAIAMGFGLISPRAAIPRLERTVARVGPALLVRDPAEFASMVLAEREGVPTVAAAGGLRSALAYFSGLLDEHVRHLRQEVGVPSRGTVLSDELLFTATPPGFDEPGDVSVPVVRYRQPAPLSAVPVDDPPVVYATLGTEVMRQPGGSAVLAAVVDAMARLDVRAVITTGVDVDGLELGEVPAHVQLRRFVDHREIIPTSRVVVTHGGAGTVQDALLMGRPMVVLPQFADQFLNAGRVAGLGLGLALMGPDQTGERIAAAVEEVLRGGFDAAVQRIGAEARELPDLAAHLPRLEALTRTDRSPSPAAGGSTAGGTSA